MRGIRSEHVRLYEDDMETSSKRPKRRLPRGQDSTSEIVEEGLRSFCSSVDCRVFVLSYSVVSSCWKLMPFRLCLDPI